MRTYLILLFSICCYTLKTQGALPEQALDSIYYQWHYLEPYKGGGNYFYGGDALADSMIMQRKHEWGWGNTWSVMWAFAWEYYPTGELKTEREHFLNSPYGQSEFIYTNTGEIDSFKYYGYASGRQLVHLQKNFYNTNDKLERFHRYWRDTSGVWSAPQKHFVYYLPGRDSVWYNDTTYASLGIHVQYARTYYRNKLGEDSIIVYYLATDSINYRRTDYQLYIYDQNDSLKRIESLFADSLGGFGRRKNKYTYEYLGPNNWRQRWYSRREGNWVLYESREFFKRTIGTRELYEPGFLLYPVPANNYLNVETGNRKFNSARILRIDGQQVNNLPVENGRINLQTLPAGHYLLQLEDGRGMVQSQFIKE